MSDVVSVEMRGRIAVISFNRPEALNAITLELAKAFQATLARLDASPEVDGVVVTGAGDRAFCAGVDLKETRSVKVEDVERWFSTICGNYKQILMTSKPVIAALNGVASGGGFQMALVSDMRVAHDGVRLGQPEINAGIPSIMGSYWMGFHLPLSVNQDLSLTGRMMDMAEAERYGLINRLVAKDALLDEAAALAESLAEKLPTAWARTKRRFRDQALAGFEEALRVAVLGQQEAFAKGEPQAFIDAFFAKKTG